MKPNPPTTYHLPPTNLKVAIVCDWLTGIGGAERVVLELHRMFPNAPIYTSQYNPKKIDWFNDADVRTGWLQKLPSSFKKFLPVLRAWYFSHLDLSEYDLIISNNFGAESKSLKFGNKTHICICNSPTHYYWSRYDSYLKNPGVPYGFNWLARLGLKVLVKPMRRWDYKAAQRPSHMIAISTHIQAEIKKYYDRDSMVIHPPVDTARFKLDLRKITHSQGKTERAKTVLSERKVAIATLKEEKQFAAVQIWPGDGGALRKSSKLPPTTYHLPIARQGFIITGRQTHYKRIDLAVAACTNLGLPLTVVGDGPDHDKLVRLAGPTITFVTGATDEQVTKHFAKAAAFIFPGLDDFGIVPVEALSAGMPVIAYKGGGALDYVIPGKSGVFFTEQTVASLVDCLKSFNPSDYNPSAIQEVAQQFSIEHFHQTLNQTIESLP